MARFSEPQDDTFRRLNDSISFDWRLAGCDLELSRAHVAMLARAGIISARGRGALREALDRVKEEVDEDSFSFADSDEDVHMAVEDRHGNRRIGGGQAPHRPLTQRSGGHRHGLVRAWSRAQGGRAFSSALARTLLKARRRASGLADARLYPPATSPAGLSQPPLAGVRVDAGPRPRAVRAGRRSDPFPAAWR